MFPAAKILQIVELQGVYTFERETPAIQVNTFCVHGGPDGYITGIRGNVQCLSEDDLKKNATDLEKREMIKEKCYLRFPTLPFIPKEPYDVIATDYDNFALVSGAKDTSFVQVTNSFEKYPATYKNVTQRYLVLSQRYIRLQSPLSIHLVFVLKSCL